MAADTEKTPAANVEADARRLLLVAQTELTIARRTLTALANEVTALHAMAREVVELRTRFARLEEIVLSDLGARGLLSTAPELRDAETPG